MKKTIWKSIGAILAGFITGAILSIATDVLMSSQGIINDKSFKENPAWIILVVLMYRFLYNVIGCYLTAKLAPNKPMKHALIIGFIGTFLGILGSVAMWDQAVAWYNISVILISIPSAWIGAKLAIGKIRQTETGA